MIVTGLQLNPTIRTENHLDPLTSKVSVDSGYFEYNEASKASQQHSGRLVTKTVYDKTNRPTSSEQRFETEPDVGDTLSSESWVRDVIGNVTEYTDALDRKTRFRNDYEVPVSNSEPGITLAADPKWLYDSNDYRGNVTHVQTVGLLSISEYETDDSQQDAVGSLRRTFVKEGDDHKLENVYIRDTDGRLKEINGPNGYNEVWTYSATGEQLQSHSGENGHRIELSTHAYS